MTGWISYDSEGNRQEWRPPTEDSVARKLAEAAAGGCATATTPAPGSTGKAHCGGAIERAWGRRGCAISRAGWRAIPAARRT